MLFSSILFSTLATLNLTNQIVCVQGKLAVSSLDYLIRFCYINLVGQIVCVQGAKAPPLSIGSLSVIHDVCRQAIHPAPRGGGKSELSR